MRAAGLQDRQKAVDIRADVGMRMGNRVTDSGLSGEMGHEFGFAAGEKRQDRFTRCDVAALEFENP